MKTTPIAKITRPVITHILPRKRLFQHLKSSRDKPIIWVSGPPGSGKTTLVASYLEACKIPCLWYQVDEGDADIATFFYYMSTAVKNAAPGIRKPLKLLTPEYLKGIPTFTRRYFEDLCTRVKTPFILVYDNYQEVPLNSEFHEMIIHGLDVVPKGVNVIVLSRKDSPPSFARFLVNNKMSVLGWNEIRFTMEESKEIFRIKGQETLSDEVFLQAHKKTGGWIAGLVLIMKSAGLKQLDYQALEALIPEEIFHYFAVEIFEKTDKEIQEFLLKTAFLPRVNAQMAEKLTGISISGKILSDLNRNNYFTERHSDYKPVYEYHPLFKDFLLSRARNSFTHDEVSAIQRNAAFLSKEAGWIEDAVTLAREAEDWEEFVKLILGQSQSFISGGRFKTLEEWIMSIPEEIMDKIPWLQYWLGICRMPFNPNESLPYFEKAFHQFKEQRDAAGIFLALSGVLDSISHSFSAFMQFDRWIPTFFELLSEYREFPSKDIEARVVNSMLYAFMLRQPQHPDYETWAERALSLTKDIADINIRIHTLAPLAGYRLFSGELSKAKLIIDLFRGIIQSSSVTQLALIWLKDEDAVYYRLTANFEECHKSATEGLKLASESGIHFMDHFLLGNGAAGALSTGEMATAKKYLHDLSLHLGKMPLWSECLYHTLETWSALLQKNLSKALSHADMALKLSDQIGMPQTEAIYHLGKALVMHELGKKSGALEHIAETRKICSSVKILQVEFRCLLAEAQFAFDRRDETSGLDFLRKAMSLGKEQGYVTTDFWIPSVMAKLCIKALEAGIEIEYVQDLIRRRNLIPEPPPIECENWPWAVKIHTLGQFGLFINGKPLQFPVKAHAKLLEMLKVLIAFGGRDINEYQLADTLWPEADGDKAHSAFSTSLHRLRQLLGNEKAIQVRGGRVSLDLRYCWVDAYAFERLLEQAESSGSIDLIGKAISLYKGAFLSDVDEVWVYPFREHLRSKFLREVERLGNIWEKDGQWDKAAHCYCRGLEVDNLSEGLYQRLMICYQQLGRRADAIEVYNRCRKTLHAVLGVEPSNKTEAIYKRIMQDVNVKKNSTLKTFSLWDPDEHSE